MTRAPGVILAVIVAGCAVLPQGEQVTVAIHGRSGWRPPTELVLQIGHETFEGFGGVVAVPVDGPVDVYVVERMSCESRIGFRAIPGGRYVVRLGKANAELRELMGDEPMDAGPLLGPAPPLDCPAT